MDWSPLVCSCLCFYFNTAPSYWSMTSMILKFWSGNTSNQSNKSAPRQTVEHGVILAVMDNFVLVAGANPALQSVQSNQFEIKWWNSTTWSREARWRRPELKRFQVATPSPLDHHGSSSFSKRNPMWGEYPVFRLTHMLFKDVQSLDDG